uniref:Uncharacterized protein n=1 Tax=Cacopsylla melanoneura TaxID=428564 RepID=A0A8D9FFJ3_9HEMI
MAGSRLRLPTNKTLGSSHAYRNGHAIFFGQLGNFVQISFRFRPEKLFCLFTHRSSVQIFPFKYVFFNFATSVFLSRFQSSLQVQQFQHIFHVIPTLKQL